MKLSTIFLSFFVFWTHFAQAQIDCEKYQQETLQLVDPQGDECLLELATNVLKGVLGVIRNGEVMKVSMETLEIRGEKIEEKKSRSEVKGLPPMEEWTEELVQQWNNQIQVEGRTNPIRIRGMKQMMQQVMVEESFGDDPLTPTVGEFHQWAETTRDSDAKKEFRAVHWGTRIFTSKLVIALSMGLSRKFLATGQEQALEDYILSLPEEGLTIPELFRKSYRLNRGNVYLTILTIENVLSYYWRDPNRSEREMTGKLSQITNRWQGRGDRFGAWYHFFGIMVYAYQAGGLAGRFVAWGESMASRLLGEGGEYQEDWINWTGAAVGAKLHKMVSRWDKKERKSKPKYLERGHYLDLEEDVYFRGQIYSMPDSRYSSKLGSSRPDGGGYTWQIEIKNIEENPVARRCDIMVIPHMRAEDVYNYAHKKVYKSELIPKKGRTIYDYSVSSADGFAAVLDIKVFFDNCELAQ